jgi:hypothetical protein
MIERDKFAFAALAAILNSDSSEEVIHDQAKREGRSQVEATAETAYTFGDAMFKEALKRDGNVDEFTMK